MATSISTSHHSREGNFSIDLDDLNITFANTSARGSAIDITLANNLERGSPSTSVTLTAPSPTIWQGAHHRPRRCQHFDKGLTVNLDSINCTLTNNSARGSPSTSVTLTAPSPTL
jgi:hypothetical protein